LPPVRYPRKSKAMTPEQLFEAGLAAHRQGDLSGAGRHYGEVLKRLPNHIGALHMLGVVRAQQERYGEAHDLLAQVLKYTPRDPLALNNFANILNSQRKYPEALNAIEQALAAAPQYADAWMNRGNVLAGLERLEEALASHDRALALQPDSALILKARAQTLESLRRYDAALANYDRALALAPQFAEAHQGRGDVLQRLCRYEEAVAAYDQALALKLGHVDVWNNRGVALQNLRRLTEAEESFRRAVALAPSLPEPRVNQGMLYLLQQDFSRGWTGWASAQGLQHGRDGRARRQPLFTGAEDLAGKTLFAYLRKGLGDAIQFYRYGLLARERGAQVVLSLNDPLLPLLRNAVDPLPVLGLEEEPERFDYHVSLMNLPGAFGLGAVPMDRYLAAEPARVAAWRDRIGQHGYKIGVAWQGDAAALGAEGKAFPLAALQKIAGIPGVRLINLQKNAGAEQLRALPEGMQVETFDDLDSGPGAFLDSAAIMENLDLVISCDTAIAHLAGALGVAAWIALKFVPEWRWFLDRSDSPWYPRARLFRQQKCGDWEPVFAAMETDLREVTVR
jgi:tetratricopeptide (TPR) repeat protein